MTEEELMLLPNNDRHAQCCRSLCISNQETIANKRREEIEKCNHLFLKLRDKEYINSCHSSDCYDDPMIVECVYCGLTNKFSDLEEIFTDQTTYCNRWHSTIESSMFKEIFKDSYRRAGKSFDDKVFKIMSDDPLDTDQARLLYQLALIIKPDGTNEELFDIMKNLNELETNLEKWKLSKVEQCDSLLERYKERKVFIKK